MLTNAQKAELRYAVLEVLATRAGIALDVSQIIRRLDSGKFVDFPLAAEDILAALALLGSLKLAEVHVDPLGSTEYWRATGKGVLHHERGRL